MINLLYRLKEYGIMEGTIIKIPLLKVFIEIPTVVVILFIIEEFILIYCNSPCCELIYSFKTIQTISLVINIINISMNLHR